MVTVMDAVRGNSLQDDINGYSEGEIAYMVTVMDAVGGNSLQGDINGYS